MCIDNDKFDKCIQAVYHVNKLLMYTANHFTQTWSTTKI